MSIIVKGMLIVVALFAMSAKLIPADKQDIDEVVWWKKTHLYHIFVRSFKDTDGNGEGDIRGITEKLDYLMQIGVETLLLSPFYSSPMKDCGYDIDNYLAVNPNFGTMEDFETLVAELKKRSMRIVIDFVPNHTSDQHTWFKCSERALIDPENCGKYKDYYIWSDSTRSKNGRPNNWIAIFGDMPAWHWSDVRKEFYFHQFLPEQPDLNLRNPLVREELKEVERFWLRKGIDGLRIDSVFLFIEDEQMRDEPENPYWVQDYMPYNRLLHIYTSSLSESARVVKDWRDVINEPEFKGDQVIIVEAYESIPKIIECYGPSPEVRYSDMPLGFQFVYDLKPTTRIRPQDVEKLINDWLSSIIALSWPKEHGTFSPWSTWVTGNHDNSRLSNRFGDRNVDSIKMIAHLTPGVPVDYYGDEIGMMDSNFNDIPQQTIEVGERSRLTFRGPMAWSSAEPCGDFSTNESPWIPLSENFRTNNVETMLKSARKNHLKNFIQLQEIRRKYMSTFVFGDIIFFPNNPVHSSIFAMARSHEEFDSLLLLINFNNDETENVNLIEQKALFSQQMTQPPKYGKVIMVNYELVESNRLFKKRFTEGSEVDVRDLALAPNQAVLIQYNDIELESACDCCWLL